MRTQKADILAQRPRRPRLARRLAVCLVVLTLPAITVVTAFGIAPGTIAADLQQATVRESIALPDFKPVSAPAANFTTHERVLRGDTVAALFERLGVSDARAMEFLRADAVGRAIFRQLVPGRMMQAETGPAGELISLRYFLSPSSLMERSEERRVGQ